MNASDTEAQTVLQNWANALTSMCIVGRDGDYYVQNPELMFDNRRYLRRLFTYWEIETGDALKQEIERLLSEGIRKEYEEMSLTMSTIADSDRLRYIQSESADAKRKYRLSIVNQYLWRLPDGGVAAHDYSWAIFKCCAGVKLDYIKEEEKWDCVGRIVPMVKDSFSSWKDYLYSFSVGAAFSSLQLNANFVSESKAQYAKLLVSQHSPLHKVNLK